MLSKLVMLFADADAFFYYPAQKKVERNIEEVLSVYKQIHSVPE